MKSLVVLISLSQLLFLVAFSSCTTLGTRPGSDGTDVVIDAVYADVRYDKRYFVMNALLDTGGVTRGLNGGLVQTPSPADFALSVVFKPMTSNTEELVIENTPLNIVLYTSSPAAVNVWKVEGFPGTSPPFFLSSNGVEGNPLDVTSWFQIKKVSYFSYKLVFCPWQSTCTDVGFQKVDGERRLVVTTNATEVFPIVFFEDSDTGGGLPVVLDSVNTNLRTDTSYFLVHSFSVLGGGVSRVGARNRLVQSADEVEFGMSVVFTPKKKQKQVEITESTPLNVVFNTPLQGTKSNNGTMWKVEGLKESPPYFLSSNGEKKKDDSVFQIKRVNYFSYSLVFCRSKKVCSDVAFMFVDGERRLALTTSGSVIFPLLFVKAPPRVVAMDCYHFDLRFDRRYYVVNSLSTAGGGLRPGPDKTTVQSLDPVDYGVPVVFIPMDPNSQDELILESTPLRIAFYDSSSSRNGGNAWTVEGFPGTSPYFLSSNGTEGNSWDTSSWFLIKKSSYFSFKLVFCQTKDTCGDLGLQVVDGVTRLVFATGKTNFPLVFILDETSVPGKSSI